MTTPRHSLAIRWNPDAIARRREERQEIREDAEDRMAEAEGRPRPQRNRPQRGKPPKRLHSETENALDALVDDFISERQAGGFPVPTRRQVLDRIAGILANVDLTLDGGTNSASSNGSVFVVGRDAPPYFGVGTAEK